MLLQLRDRIVATREPDVLIGGSENPYLRRWHVIPRNYDGNVYLHQFLRSDDDRALHDHPWESTSILIEGTYLEHMERDHFIVKAQRKAGDVVQRAAEQAHRIELTDGPAWSLFITGPNVREWGFHCPKTWVHWKDFTAYHTTGEKGEVGPGCGE